MDVAEAIKGRCSIRNYNQCPIDLDIIKKIIRMGTLAPSGKNIQPWRFVVIRDKQIIQKLSRYTYSRQWFKTVSTAIIVYLDTEVSYDFVKDTQAIGAAIQNMLLYAYSINIGSCWIGDIVNFEKSVKDIVNVPDTYKLEAMIALGYPDVKNQIRVERKEVDEVIYNIL